MLLRHALLLDLETSHRGAILKMGLVLGPRELAWEKASRAADASKVLADFCAGAKCLLGHNLLRHDLPVLRERHPEHPVLRLPVIDTLVLSPIAFPENPYHRLVKDYKLVKESVNDPVADAKQAALLFADELKSLAGLRQTEPRLFDLLHFLLATPEESAAGIAAAEGMEMVFTALGGNRPSQAQALALCRQFFARWGCSDVPVHGSLIETAARRSAVAYALTWMRVAGSNSVLPPWVRLESPFVVELLNRLREIPCAAPECSYCRRVHDSRAQLQAFFDWEVFRAKPENARGESLQREIVEAGLRNESHLAILPTGGGKSLCYQLPALVRNYRRGLLTIIISPLQALMKDQVDGLIRRTGTPWAAALYGLLTPPERGDVLRRVRMGDVALLYVSPEQLRNRSFRDAVAQREIGCWVFDEAHCLSKWGHDFRPDYLYAGRFIREFSTGHGGVIPPIACFTATAKRDVKEEIIRFFKEETGRDLALYEGGVERDNLRFEVQTVTAHARLERVHELLSERLPSDERGSAIVFRSTRNGAREAAEYLRQKSWLAAHFHAGLTPPEKKRVQDDFLAGTVRVICATNAFGMGIDKEDVRLVIHADTPGSLENYLQEAGRAGRDGESAQCILLYDEADVEQQFRLGSFSELSRRDIAQILRTLRKAASRSGKEVVITSGEILRDEDVDFGIAVEDANADTKVRTAISWLERSGFLQRDENVTSVFQARPLVRDMAEAGQKIAALNLPPLEQALWKGILREVMNASPTESLTVDRLALMPEFAAYAQRAARPSPDEPASLHEASVAYGERANPEYISAKILKILRSMAEAGLMKRDVLLTAFVRYKIADGSRVRLERVLQADRKMVDLLAIEEPDPEGWLPLSLRHLNQRLLDEGVESSIELLQNLLKSLGEDGRGFAGSHGSVDLRHQSRDVYLVRLRRSWTTLGALAEKRRRIAGLALDVLLGKIPAGTPPRADLLVEFSFEELQRALEQDLILRSEIREMDVALERALMYLHEHHVIALQQGLAVFRSAMTIRLRPEAKGQKYASGDYQPLQHYYHERIFQVHVMSAFAREGLKRIQEALALVLAYFSMEKEKFIRRFLGVKPDLLEHATTAASFQRIVSDLGNPAQVKIVSAPPARNMLILAGPGSGKTKTVVHRCAYLLRVERVRPQSILICCFNRNAAFELRRRLAGLVGPDARGVTVLTYHSLALRLLGFSMAGRAQDQAPDFNLDSMIVEATRLLRGETTRAGVEPDEIRDRLLSGYQHILVDEYQDIDAPQYELISAIAGRTLEDPEMKLSILAVGDDDQNIYSFRGTNVQFIRQFQHDYNAQVHHLVENYRSTGTIIEAANQLIACNNDRMKTQQPIRIDRQRDLDPPGGAFGRQDLATQGKVQVLSVPDEAAQAAAVLEELRRLRELGVEWSNIAVLSRTHRELAQVRCLAEQQQIPIRWWADRNQMPPLHRIREIHRFLKELGERRTALVRASDLIRSAEEMFPNAAGNPWTEFLFRMLVAWRDESDDAELPAQEALEFLYETCAENRRDFSYGRGVTLCTVHAAKGTEHDHVLLIGHWPASRNVKEREEIRRLFYVGMTRARHSLAIFDQEPHPTVADVLEGPAIIRREAKPTPTADQTRRIDYKTLGMEDLYLSYGEYFPPDHPTHLALARLQPGDEVSMRPDARGIGLFDFEGTQIARLSRKAEAFWNPRLNAVREVRVLAITCRTSNPEDQKQPGARQSAISEWEIPVVEVMFSSESQARPIPGHPR